MAKRKTVFGLPVGKKKKSPLSQLGRGRTLAGVGLAAAPLAVPVARRVGRAVSSGTEKVQQATDVAQTASNIKDAVSEQPTKLGKVRAVVSEMGKLGGGGEGKTKLSHLISEKSDIAVARPTLYNQWTQFEMFPSITKGVEGVEQQDSAEEVSWKFKIGPSRRELTACITEQVPDERIAFEGKGGLDLHGVVTFHSIDRDLTRVGVQMQYSPKGFIEGVGNLFRIPRRRVRRDLRLYKHFVELRNEETGAWRGRIGKDSNGQASSNGKNSRSNGQRSVSRSGAGRKAS